MKRYVLPLLLATATLGTALAAPAQPNCYYNTNVDFLILREGVEGGIAPKVPTLQMFLLKQRDGGALVFTTRPSQKGLLEHKKGKLASFSKAAESLKATGLMELPKDSTGMDDIYGFKVGIHVHVQGQCWDHSPPNGCIRSTSTVKTTAEEKQKFQQASKVLEEVARHADKPATQAEFVEALKGLSRPQK